LKNGPQVRIFGPVCPQQYTPVAALAAVVEQLPQRRRLLEQVEAASWHDRC
jgi:hypothetical protein